MKTETLIEILRGADLVDGPEISVTPLTGGVSSDIRLVTTPERSFVVKRALHKLRVQDDWYADVSRNDYEQAYLRYVGEIVPKAVPSILFSDPDAGLFVMEYLGDGFENWKSALLVGDVDPTYADEAGRILGEIHRASWGDQSAAETFDSTSNFFELRLDPYLLTTAARHPELAAYLEAESERIQETRLCLVHGDFSPKNMLVREGRLVLLDCEVAWYGEPAFDAAFLLNHFLLKSLHFSADPEPYTALASRFWSAYTATLGDPFVDGLEARVVRLLPMLMLARIDGKSPVEYITEMEKQELIRRFAAEIIPDSPRHLTGFLAKWRSYLPESKQDLRTT